VGFLVKILADLSRGRRDEWNGVKNFEKNYKKKVDHRVGATLTTAPSSLRRTVLKREGRTSLSKFNLEREVFEFMLFFFFL